MFSTKKNVLQLVALLKEAGIRDYILCPGSRNIPLVQTIASIEEFHCTSVTDERSAGFYAIGMMQAVNRPVAVCCTSGSAVLNLHPAVCEAYYQELPLLLLTADRPQEWIGQMDGQTLPQAEAYSSLVRKCVVLPQVHDKDEEWYCNRLINEALYALNYPQKGPVQIDVPLAEPFFDFSEKKLPRERLIRHYEAVAISVPEELIRILQESRRTLLIIGQRSYQNEDLHDLMHLCVKNGIVILAEYPANLPDNDATCRHFDEVLSVSNAADYNQLQPDLVIYCGGHIVSKRLKNWLRKHKPSNEWRITSDGGCPDTFQNLTATIRTPNPRQFLEQLIERSLPADKKQTYLQTWKEAERQVQPAKHKLWDETRYSDITILQNFAGRLQQTTFKTSPSIQVANSSMVRNLQLTELPSSVRVLCNRGANGIEGTVSTSVGYSLLYNGLTFCLTGDLSFFYDMNGLWHHPLPPGLRILLINNGNGQIFHYLPNLSSPYLKQFISASHSFHAEGWAAETGMTYIRCEDYKSLQTAWSRFFSEQEERPVMIEAVTDEQTNERLYKEYYNQFKRIQL